MLDENLRVLSRRINELEVECLDRQEKLETSERARKTLEDRLATVHD